MDMGRTKQTSSKGADNLLKELSNFIAIPEEGTSYVTHGIHPYSAKFIPQLPAKIIEECVNERHVVLDPFSGSGTTLLEARLHGIDSIGFDTNPIAAVVSRVKVTPLSKKDWDDFDKITLKIKSKFEENDYSQSWIPEIPQIDHWFEPKIIKDLGLIAGEIKKIKNIKIKQLLEVIFSSIIVVTSNQDSETRFAAIKKNLALDAVEKKFLKKLNSISKSVKELSDNPKVLNSKSDVFFADSRELSKHIPKNSIDLVITSPPYLNSYEYYLYHKFRMYWLSFDKNIVLHDKSRENEIGSRHEYAGKNGKPVEKFRKEIFQCFKEVSIVTKPGKLIFIIVGDSQVRGEFIDMDKFYTDVCKEIGMDFIAKTSYDLKSITRSFKSQLGVADRININKQQHILIFQNRSNITIPLAKNTETIESNNVVEKIPDNVKNGSILSITNNQVIKYTHGIVKYPSKFIPEIPRWAIENFSEEGDVVFDPFVGSGTTLVESRILGRNAVGLDINPFAVLASNVKSNPLEKTKLDSAFQKILKRIPTINHIKLKEIPLRDFWFDDKVLQKLTKIQLAILEENDPFIRDFFLLSLGTIIKPCSYWDESQIKVERDQRKLLQGVPDPFELFTKKSKIYISASQSLYEIKTNVKTSAFTCDSTSIPKTLNSKHGDFKFNKVDLVVTSPPYINAINYSMFNRYELQLLDLVDPVNYNDHQRDYLGTERVVAKDYNNRQDFELGSNKFKDLNKKLKKIESLEPKRAYITQRYFEGMVKTIENVHRILKPGGKFVIIAGSNTIKGVPIPTWEILNQYAEELGFKQKKAFAYEIRNHRFKLLRHSTGRQITIDNVTVLEKL